MATLDVLAHLRKVEWSLRYEDRRGAARGAGHQCDPARVAAHHLDDHHAIVAFSRGVQSIDCIGRDLHRGVEAERDVGSDDVVVDGLRHSDDRQTSLCMQPRPNGQRSVATDHDQRTEIEVGELLARALDAVAEVVGAAPSGAEDRAPLW